MASITLITSHFLPENTACTTRMLSFIKELEKYHTIDVVALGEKGAKHSQQLVKHSENVTVHYVEQDTYDGKHFFTRACKEIKYSKKLANLAKTFDNDITIATSPYIFLIPFVAFKIKNKKILDIRDLAWEYLPENNIINKLIKSTLRQVMKLGMRSYDHILVTNDSENEIVKDRYGFNKINIVSNGVSQYRYDNLIKLTPDSSDKTVVTYVGNVGLAQNLIVFLDAAIKMKNVDFLIIGDGVEIEKMKAHKEKNKIDNIKIIDKVDWEELKSYYSQSSILYAQLDEKYNSAMPSKLYEYASIGLPIVYGGTGQAKIFIDNLENTFCVEPNNVDQLIDAIHNASKLNSDISTKNREFIGDNYIRENSVAVIEKIIKDLINNNGDK